MEFVVGVLFGLIVGLPLGYVVYRHRINPRTKQLDVGGMVALLLFCSFITLLAYLLGWHGEAAIPITLCLLPGVSLGIWIGYWEERKLRIQAREGSSPPFDESFR